MATYLYTHNDLDALGCAIVAELVYGNVTSTSYNSYQTIDGNIDRLLETGIGEDNLLLIADICPSEETCEKLDAAHRAGNRIQLVDHHKTKMWVNKYKWAICDDSTACGAKLLWLLNKQAHQNIQDAEEYSKLIEAINAWDLWKLDSEHRERGERLNTLLKFIGRKEFLASFQKNPNADKAIPYAHVINYLEKSKNDYVKKVLREQLHKARYYMDDLGNTFKILFVTDYISDVGNAALADKDSEDLKYVVMINPVYGTCSLRAREGEIDVSTIAQRLGGGGHRAAAGFKTDVKERIERQIYKLLTKIDS